MEETLGKRIAANRKRLKLTQDQLAEKLGVTAQAVSKWENDQSCPDISMIPLLADIFGVSTDTLLGRKEPEKVYEAQVIDTDFENEQHNKKGWNFYWESGRKGAVGFAVLVLLVGALYLLSAVCTWDLSLWEILWPSALLIFGTFGLFSKFSFFNLGCLLFGGLFLTNKLFSFELLDDSKFLWGIVIVLFGISLFIDAIRKLKNPVFRFTHGRGKKNANFNKRSNSYSVHGSTFQYAASFNEEYRRIDMEAFRHGDISVCFGEYTVDLSGIVDVTPGCALDANCSFGELKLLVPSTFKIQLESSSCLAAITTEGAPNISADKEIRLDASANFGQIIICYI